jgi:hypothetical protein
MSVSILVVDDEADVAELFRQRFRRKILSGPDLRRVYVGPRRSSKSPLRHWKWSLPNC